MVSMNETASFSNGYNATSTVHILADARRKEVKATQNLSIIVLFFILCWMPLYTINCIQAFCINCQVADGVMYAFIILSHLNSAGNPLLYAYHLSDFRNAFRRLIFGSFTSSAENVIGGRLEGSDFERGIPKRHQMISINFNARKYKFTKNSSILFKFNEKETNTEVKLKKMDDKPVEQYSNTTNVTNIPNQYFAISRNARNCGFYSNRLDSDKDSNYVYLNSEYLDDNLSVYGNTIPRKRIHSAVDDSSYILMINDECENRDEIKIQKSNVFDPQRRIMRRHSMYT